MKPVEKSENTNGTIIKVIKSNLLPNKPYSVGV